MSTRMPYKTPNLFPPLVLKKLSPQTVIRNAALVFPNAFLYLRYRIKRGMYRYDLTCKIEIKLTAIKSELQVIRIDCFLVHTSTAQGKKPGSGRGIVKL